MKLFLHWLLWDLRRFRSMLIFWSVLVLGYAALLGWMHARILTVQAGWMEWNATLAVGLGVMEFFLLLVLFISDPGVGTDAFWKTRPPTGRAVAGAKLVIALGFFLVLPLAAWGVMHWRCVLPGGPRQGWEGMSWTRLLCLIQSMGLLVFLVAGAEVRDARHLLLKIAAVVVLAGVLRALWPLIYFGLPWVDYDGSGKVSRGGWIGWAVTILSLLIGISSYLRTRQRSPSSAMQRWRSWWIPVFLLVVSPFSAPREVPPTAMAIPEKERPLEPTMAVGIRIDQSERSAVQGSWETIWIGGRREQQNFQTQLQVSGLPEGRRARGRWMELRLIPNEGPALPAEIPALQNWQQDWVGEEPGRLAVSPAMFRIDSLARLAGQACRAEGILRVQVEHPVTCSFPMEHGVIHRCPVGAWYFGGMDPEGAASAVWPDSCFDFAPDVERFFSVKNPQTGEEIKVYLGTSQSHPEFFMEYPKTVFSFQTGFVSAPLERARQLRRFSHFHGEGWLMNVRWYEPEGFVDLPVKLPLVVAPLDKNVTGFVMKTLAGLNFSKEAAVDETRRTLAYVTFLVHAEARSRESPVSLFRYEPDVNGRVQQEVGSLLKQVGVEHLPALLDLAEDVAKHKSWYRFSPDEALKDRILELVQVQDLEGLRRRPELFQWLGSSLVKQGLISQSELEPPTFSLMSDAAVQAAWEQSTQRIDLDLAALEAGIGRGLPWAMAAVAECVDLLPEGKETAQIRKWMPRWSDCPVDQRGLDWLREKAVRLRWDAAAKQWR